MPVKRSKNLKEANERFIQACKNEDPKEIAIASVEILMHDKKRFDIFAYELILGLSVLEKIEVDKINVSKLNSQQIKNFVIQEWKKFKVKKEKQKESINLSEEQEKKVINTVADVIEKIEKS